MPAGQAHAGFRADITEQTGVQAQDQAADDHGDDKAAEELRRLDAETADSLARVRLDSLATVPPKRSRSSTTGFSRMKRQWKTNFSNNAHVR